jgi:hypothetical protein
MDQNLEMPKEKVAVRRRSRGWIGWVIFLLIVAATGAYLYQRPQAASPQTLFSAESSLVQIRLNCTLAATTFSRHWAAAGTSRRPCLL